MQTDLYYNNKLQKQNNISLSLCIPNALKDLPS